MKTYKIEIIYKESKHRKEMNYTVNGKSDAELPEGLQRWIAQEFIDEFLHDE